MTRVAVGIEYDGSAYAGWQAQASLPTVQQVTERALGAVAAEPVSLVAAGRTDTGVDRRARSWILGANTELPRDVSVSWARTVPAHFHARYSAEARTYHYLIANRLARSALAASRAVWVHRPLDHERMNAAAHALQGEHDFSAFRAAECQARSPIRRIERIEVERHGEWIVIAVTANAFLHHMMRNIAGLLIEIGKGEAPVGWAAEVLAERDRRRNAATAPAAGLYLRSVRYPGAFGLPAPRAAAVLPA